MLWARHSGAVTAAAAPSRSIATPCVKVCIVDGASGYCLGCARSLPEIAAWQKFDDAKRAEIMADLPARWARTGVIR